MSIFCSKINTSSNDLKNILPIYLFCFHKLIKILHLNMCYYIIAVLKTKLWTFKQSLDSVNLSFHYLCFYNY